MRQVPSHILSEVRRYDPLLNIRWSREKRKFVLERRTDKRYARKPVLYRKDGYGNIKERIRLPEYSERYIQFHNPALPIAYFDKMDRRVMWFIYDNDSYKIGIGKKYVNEIEYRERKAEERDDAKQSVLLRELGSEAYDHMKRRGGERMSMNG